MQDGTYYLSEDTVLSEDGVMFVYDDNGKLLYGTMPEKFETDNVKSHTPRVIKSQQ